MKPVAVRVDHIARPLGQGLVVVGPNHAIHHLDAVTAWVWQHADGSRDIDGLLAGLRSELHGDADRELVFEACDRLADAGLLEKRVAPPTGVSRRVLLERLAGASAIAALTAVVGTAGTAMAAEGGLCAEDKALISELAYLEAEQAAVADILDEWVDEAQDDETVDDFYVAELIKSEAQRKKLASSWGNQLDAAEGDLAECKLAAKQGLEQRMKHRKVAYQKAQEHHQKRSHKIQEQDAKAKLRLDNRHENLTKEMNAKAQQIATIPDEAQRYKMEEELAKRGNHLERRSERRRKQQIVRTHQKEGAREETQKDMEVRYAASLENLTATRLRQEERVKAQAAGYTAKASEDASKQAGVDDRVLEIAQADALQAGFAAEKQRKMAEEQEQKKSAQEEYLKKEQQAAAEQKQKGEVSQEYELKSKQAAEQKQKGEVSQEQELKSTQAAEEKVKGDVTAQAAEEKAKLAAEQEAKAF